MRKPSINFARPDTKPNPILGCVMLLCGLLICAGVFYRWQQSRHQLAQVQEEITSLAQPANHQPVTPAADQKQLTEIRMAKEIADQIHRPWPTLFHALETAHTPNVYLLEVTPDAASGHVQISGQTDDLNKVFSYMNNLDKTRVFSKIQLRDYQKTLNNGKLSLRFTLTTDWMRHV